MFKSLFCCTERPHSKSGTQDSELFIQDSRPLKAVEIIIPEIPDSESSFTFKVDEVAPPKDYPGLLTAEHILRKSLYDEDKFERPGKPSKFTRGFEDFSHRKDMNAKYLSYDVPGLLAAVDTAYHCHYALSLSVSDFIILIGQGLGAHINKNAEKLRKYFVDFEGKETIEVRRDDFVVGEQSDWSTIFGDFVEQIKKRVKADVYGVIIDDTSVATATSRIVSEITLMDAMKSYFDYLSCTACGIPQVTLEGRPDDWEKLKEKVRKLVEMNKDDCLDLKWWLDELVPVVGKLCEAGIERKVDEEFWSSIYKYRFLSGTDQIGGWIIKFFPYVGCNSEERRNGFKTISSNTAPKQICHVPFIWKYYGDNIPMKFTAGFLGAEFNKELCQVKPAQFWCVTQEENSKK